MLKRIIAGFSANVFAQFAAVVVQLTLLPIMTRHWGVSTYGLWLMIAALPAYLSLADLGIAVSSGNRMVSLLARGDPNGATVVQHSARIVNLCVSAALLTLLAIGLGGVVLSNPSALARGLAAAGVMGLYSILCLQGGLAQAIYRSAGKYALGLFLNTCTILFEAFVAACVVLAGGGLIAVACSYLVCRSLGLLAISYGSRRLSPWLSKGFSQASTTEMKTLLKLSGSVLAITVGHATLLQGVVLLVGFGLGPQQAAAYVAFRTLTRVGIQFVSAINHPVMPEIAIARSAGQTARVERLVTWTVLASLVILIPGACVLIAGGSKILSIWTGNLIHVNFVVRTAMAILMVCDGVWLPLSNLLLAINRQSLFSPYFCALSIAALPATFIAGHFAGLVGIVAVLIAVSITMLIVVIFGLRQEAMFHVTLRDAKSALSALLKGRANAGA